MERSPVEHHYGLSGLLQTILQALPQPRGGGARLTPADLAPVDAFHIRGREATVELAGRGGLAPGLRVLDVGCGIGGSARYLAGEHGCRVVGIDLTAEHIDAANVLAELVGLAHAVAFQQGDALDLPFAEASFDVVWTEHVQMNVADKAAFYAGLARVLVPGGRLFFHDIFQGPGGTPHYPVPWAKDDAISFLATPESGRALLDHLGFAVADWEDTSARALAWFAGVADKLRGTGAPPLGPHLLMGEGAPAKLRNVVRNLQEGRIVAIQAIARKSA